MKTCKLALTTILLLLVFASLNAQGWRKTYDTTNDYDIAEKLFNTPDGGFALIGPGILKTDANGVQQWLADFPSGTGQYDPAFFNKNDRAVIHPDGSITVLLDSDMKCVLAKYSDAGQLLWTQTFQFGTQTHGISLASSMDGGYMLMTRTAMLPPNNGFSPWLIKTDELGELEFAKFLDVDMLAFWASSMKRLDNGNYAIVGGHQAAALASQGPAVVIIDPLGNTLLEKSYQMPGNGGIFSDIVETTDNQLIMTGNHRDSSNVARLISSRIDFGGNEVWTKTYEGIIGFAAPSNSISLAVYDMVSLPNGGVAICLYDWGQVSGSLNGFALLALDADGEQQWSKLLDYFDNNDPSYGYFGLVRTSDNGFALTGKYTGFGINAVLLQKTDSIGNIYSHLITGNVFHDKNLDCQLGNEPGLRQFVVKADGFEDFYTASDTAGNYEMFVATGDYQVSLSNKPYWNGCEPSYPLQANTLYDTTVLDIPLQAIFECPLMQVNISTPFLRLCFAGFYTVNYCNNGTIPAENATVQVTLADELSFLSATATLLSQNGQVLTFDIGTVDLNECGSFRVNFQMLCDTTLLGQTLCSEAQIFPHDFCGDDPFNGPIIETSAICQGDSVAFNIKNIGGDMGQPFEYIVVEDNIILRLDHFQLAENEEVTFSEPAQEGATYHLVAAQDPNLPSILGNPTATAGVEGCVGNVNTGALNQFSQGYGQPWLDVDCHDVRGSFDPNDKTGFPIGWTEEHLIDDRTALDYLIRFQNTGTDTAFRVVLIDTLSAFLDPATIRPGASSHPYRFELSGHGVVTFIFDDILLPDSNVNEALSHGFVQFHIAQKAGNQPGTVIENTAGIYFDYNAPIYTNTTFHTIREPWVQVLSGTVEAGYEGLKVKISPNPMGDWALFEVENLMPGENTLVLLDMTGREVMRQPFSQNKLLFNKGDLANGLYFLKLENAGILQGTGKLVIR